MSDSYDTPMVVEDFSIEYSEYDSQMACEVTLTDNSEETLHFLISPQTLKALIRELEYCNSIMRSGESDAV